MSRCPHCKKLSHSEDLYVYVDMRDIEKIEELMADIDWVPAYMYAKHENPSEWGYLKKCDIKIRFMILPSEQIEKLK